MLANQSASNQHSFHPTKMHFCRCFSSSFFFVAIRRHLLLIVTVASLCCWIRPAFSQCPTGWEADGGERETRKEWQEWHYSADGMFLPTTLPLNSSPSSFLFHFKFAAIGTNLVALIRKRHAWAKCAANRPSPVAAAPDTTNARLALSRMEVSFNKAGYALFILNICMYIQYTQEME